MNTTQTKKVLDADDKLELEILRARSVIWNYIGVVDKAKQYAEGCFRKMANSHFGIEAFHHAINEAERKAKKAGDAKGISLVDRKEVALRFNREVRELADQALHKLATQVRGEVANLHEMADAIVARKELLKDPSQSDTWHSRLLAEAAKRD